MGLSTGALTAIAAIVVGVWAVVVLIEGFGGPAVPAAVHGVAGVVVGALFGERYLKRQREESDGT